MQFFPTYEFMIHQVAASISDSAFYRITSVIFINEQHRTQHGQQLQRSQVTGKVTTFSGRCPSENAQKYILLCTETTADL